MKNKIFYGIVLVGVLCVVVYMVWPNEPMVINNTQTENEDISTTTITATGTKTVIIKKKTSTVPKTTYTILYTKNGFEPKQLQVPKGTTVKFINKTNSAMRVFAVDSAKPPYSDLSQAKALGLNGEYEFNFVYTGVWAYYNATKPSDIGNIVVY
jgi:plastocyanin